MKQRISKISFSFSFLLLDCLQSKIRNGYLFFTVSYSHSTVLYRESVVGSVIQTTGTVEFVDGLQRVALYLGFDPDSFGARLNSNLPGSVWLLVSSQALDSIHGSCGVRIDSVKGSRNVCAVPRREAKSLEVYSLSFLWEGVYSNKVQCYGFTQFN